MSNKSQLQTNNTNLDDLITRVNTAKNTAASLPNAGSATEDLNTELTTQEDLISQLSTILDSKASGGSSGLSSPVCGYFEVTDNGMFDPETNEYVFTSDNLQIANLTCVLICNNRESPTMIFFRKTINDMFVSMRFHGGTALAVVANSFIIDDHTFYLYGYIETSDYINDNQLYYMAW